MFSHDLSDKQSAKPGDTAVLTSHSSNPCSVLTKDFFIYHSSI